MAKKRSLKKPRPETLEELVEQYLKAAQDAAWQWRSVQFNYSPDTINVLEEMLEELHQEWNSKTLKKKIGLGLNESDVAQWANLWGMYLGETLRREFDGKWIDKHKEAPSLVAVEFPDSSVIFPTARVFRRIMDGEVENVATYYYEISSSLIEARNKAESQNDETNEQITTQDEEQTSNSDTTENGE